MEDPKFCPACQQWLARTEFYRNRSSSDGLQFYCKACLVEKLQRPKSRDPQARARETRRKTIQKAAIREAAETWGTEPEALKACGRCRAVRRKDEFYKNSRMPDGRDYYCIPCRRAATQASQEKRFREREEPRPRRVFEEPTIFVPDEARPSFERAPAPPPKTCYCGEIFFGDGDMCAPCQRAAD